VKGAMSAHGPLRCAQGDTCSACSRRTGGSGLAGAAPRRSMK
jgi:hypothetical protein